MIDRMLTMAKEAGDIALAMLNDCDPTLKPDQSVITKADTTISALLKTRLADLLATGDHILIDEEDQDHARYFNQEILEKQPYVWSIDPIDGTKIFANKIPLFGISIGVLKDLQPWLGVVFCPAVGELYYCDGKDAFFVSNAFSPEETRTKIVPVDEPITPKSILIPSNDLLRYNTWDYSLCDLFLPACAVIELCWPAVGRGCGSYFGAHLWDLAGSWPIFQKAGLELRSLKSGTVLDRIHTDHFVGEGTRTWRLKDHHILSSASNFDQICSAITSR